MEYYVTESDEFFVAGIAVRTTNQDGRSQFDISELWGKFMVDQLAHQIPGRVSEDIYCVYTDYGSDHTGYYTAVLGCRVRTIDHPGGGFIGVAVPGGKFRVYQPEGELPGSVANTWLHIWQADIDRKYAADYDLYYAGGELVEARVEVYVGVR